MPGRAGPPSDDWSRGEWRRTRDQWRTGRVRDSAQGARGWSPRGARRGFGCLFGLLFLVIAGSLVAGTALILSRLGVVPGILALGFVLLLLVWMGRALFVTGRALDRLVDATRRVSAGDYSARVGPSPSPGGVIRVIRELDRGFDAMAERLETDERQRRTMLADISHELRTPLTVVQGHIEAMVDGIYPADPSHLEVILEETRVLSRLIDDLRTLALSEAGTLTLHPEPTDLDVLVAEVVRSFEPAASAALVDLTASDGAPLPLLEVDPIRIREVLSNLVANAIRHTPPSGRVTVTSASEPGHWVRLDVRDTGTGIDPDLLDHVFDRFAKGDASTGSGLGLAIARQLVLVHGGEISATSELGAGTVVTVRLPVTGA